MDSGRRPPRGVLRWLLRLPTWLYRLKLGWLLGGRFLLLRHRGRKSGLPRENVLEVIGRGDGGAYVVIAAWGDRTQWLRNVVAEPRVEVKVGRTRFPAEAIVLSHDGGRSVLEAYAREHRLAIKVLLRLFAYDSVEALSRHARVVELHPR